ncbi:MAG: hypothetical protein LBJ04_23775 [Sphingobacterium sp.]|nr:hypothetical protein [Sphingobacterium sp.]
MKKYLLLSSILISLMSCQRDRLETELNTKKPKSSFNLAMLKKFTKAKSIEEKALFAKKAGTKANGSNAVDNESAMDQLLWDYAVKEVVNDTKYSYLIPLSGGISTDKIVDYIADKGYRMINFYSDQNQQNVYARLREYRPRPSYIDSLCQVKNISMTNYDYTEYQQVLANEKFDGHIVVFNLDGKAFKLIKVSMGKVGDVLTYND